MDRAPGCWCLRSSGGLVVHLCAASSAFTPHEQQQGAAERTGQQQAAAGRRKTRMTEATFSCHISIYPTRGLALYFSPSLYLSLCICSSVSLVCIRNHSMLEGTAERSRVLIAQSAFTTSAFCSDVHCQNRESDDDCDCRLIDWLIDPDVHSRAARFPPAPLAYLILSVSLPASACPFLLPSFLFSHFLFLSPL